MGSRPIAADLFIYRSSIDLSSACKKDEEQLFGAAFPPCYKGVVVSVRSWELRHDTDPSNGIE